MKKYGLIGHPLSHSFSKEYFNEKFRGENIDAEYINFDIESIDSLTEIVATNPTLQGLNVTIPYKEQVMGHLNHIDDDAKSIGAVNTISINRSGKHPQLTGYNSDSPAFYRSIKPLLEHHHTKALILGTGGAGKAVEHALRKLGLETQFVSRTKKQTTLTYEELTPEIVSDYKVIVNCTPLGMYPHIEGCPLLPFEAIGNKHLLYDLIYNPDETTFLRKGRLQGAQTKNGLEMLLLQASISWEDWNNTIEH